MTEFEFVAREPTDIVPDDSSQDHAYDDQKYKVREDALFLGWGMTSSGSNPYTSCKSHYLRKTFFVSLLFTKGFQDIEDPKSL